LSERRAERSEPKQVAQLSQRDRAAGWLSYGHKWKTGAGYNIYGHYVTYLASKAIEFGKKNAK